MTTPRSPGAIEWTEVNTSQARTSEMNAHKMIEGLKSPGRPPPENRARPRRKNSSSDGAGSPGPPDDRLRRRGGSPHGPPPSEGGGSSSPPLDPHGPLLSANKPRAR